MTGDDFIAAAAARLTSAAQQASISELHAVLALLGRHPELNMGDVLRSEAVARVVNNDPTAPVFVAAWRAHLERLAFSAVVGAW